MLVDMDEFYGRIKKGEHPKSSQPPIGEVMDVYEKYANDEVINIAMADGLSGTYQSACGAKNMVATLGSVLKLKPIMTQTPDGKYIIYVSHARAKEDAEKAVALLKEAFAEVEIRMLDLGAAIVTQRGPQCVAIQYIEK